MSRRISGFKPTGSMHLGNYLGAIRPMVAGQARTDSIVFIADLHALDRRAHPGRGARPHAGERDAAARRRRRPGDHHRVRAVPCARARRTALPAGVRDRVRRGAPDDPVQGEGRPSRRQVRLSLLTYPVLMAADILLHDTHDVPVGADQTQHVELARDVAIRFNPGTATRSWYPRRSIPPFAARIMDLADPARKMGKSSTSLAGVIRCSTRRTPSPRKVRRAVTDPDNEVRYDAGDQAGRGEPDGDPGRVHRPAAPRELDGRFDVVRRAESRGHGRGHRHAGADPGALCRAGRQPGTAACGTARRRDQGTGTGECHSGPSQTRHRPGVNIAGTIRSR